MHTIITSPCPITEVSEELVLATVKKFKDLQLNYFLTDYFSEDDASLHHQSLKEIAQITQNILSSMCGEIPNLYFIELATSYSHKKSWGSMNIVNKDLETVFSIDKKTDIEAIMTDSFQFNVALMHLYTIYSELNSFEPPFNASIYASNIYSGAKFHPIVDQNNMSKVHLIMQ